jgi:putative signal transducing protein
MRELLRTNDAVLLSFAETVLRQAGIASVLADQHISLVEGSIGAFPRRLLVGSEDWDAACRVLTQAGLETWLIGDGDARA